jgi:hypothetical protein
METGRKMFYKAVLHQISNVSFFSERNSERRNYIFTLEPQPIKLSEYETRRLQFTGDFVFVVIFGIIHPYVKRLTCSFLEVKIQYTFQNFLCGVVNGGSFFGTECPAVSLIPNCTI